MLTSKTVMSVFITLFMTASLAYADEPGPGLLWQIKGETNSIYLLGSVHMLRASDFPLAQSAEAAYADAEALVMELDMDDLNPLAVQALFFTHGRLSDGQTLESLLGPERWATALGDARQAGFDLAMLNGVKPWWASLTIAQLQLAKLGFNPEHGVEAYFTRRASSDKKPITGLETAEFQIKLFDNMDMQRQIELLLKSLADAATLEQDMAELLSAWRSGRADDLSDLQEETFENFPALYATLIRERNEKWVTELAQLLDDEQDYLVVVGALHLVGEHSVVAGLEKLGYKPSKQ